MGYTNFPHGIASMGAPVGSNFPYDSPGDHYFCDSVYGSNSNSGKSWTSAKKDFLSGYGALRANQNDVLHLIGGATAYASAEVATLNKDYAHVVAHAAPTHSGGRARLTNTVTTATAGEFAVSGTGCVWDNVHFQWGASATATSVVGVALSGNGRNAFRGCQFEGPVDATVAGGTAIRMLTITSSQDNSFLGCSFGARTILSASAAGAVVSFNGSNNTGNVFEECMYHMYFSNTAAAAVNFVSGAMATSGYTLLRRSTFMNHTAVAIADVIRNTSVAAGMILLDDCKLCGLGTTVWATNLLTNIFVTGPAGNEAGGIAIVQT